MMGRIYGGQFKLDPKSAALTELGFNTNLTTHALHPLLHDGQSHPSIRAVRFRVERLERAKDDFVITRVDAGAVIQNPDSHLVTGFFGRDSNGRCDARFDEPNRIFNEVDENLF